LEVLRRIRKTGKPAEVIIITGHGDMENAVEALDLNASDFINKPVERQALDSALARAEKRKQMPQDMPFEFAGTIERNTFIILVKGKLTVSAKESFLSLFKSDSLKTIKEVRLIFDDSFSIDRSGISLLMAVIQDLRKKEGVAIGMENLSYNYVKVFQMVGIDKMVTLKAVSLEE
ncbi:MAG: response regulator, partial [Deltaproteobacteria bacterium]|nr:response regulator [Deltaproteobacteria bacterium]